MLCTYYCLKISTNIRATCLSYVATCHLLRCTRRTKVCYSMSSAFASTCFLISTYRTLENVESCSTTYQSLNMSASHVHIRSSEQGPPPRQPAQPVPQGDNIVCTRVLRDILSTKSLRKWRTPYRCETVSDFIHVLEIFRLMERRRQTRSTMLSLSE